MISVKLNHHCCLDVARRDTHTSEHLCSNKTLFTNTVAGQRGHELLSPETDQSWDKLLKEVLHQHRSDLLKVAATVPGVFLEVQGLGRNSRARHWLSEELERTGK